MRILLGYGPGQHLDGCEGPHPVGSQCWTTQTQARNNPDDTAIVILEPYAHRISAEVYEDLQADLAAAILDERETAAALREQTRITVESDDFRDAHERAIRAHILDEKKGWPHPRVGGGLDHGTTVMQDGCDDLCSDDIVTRLLAALPHDSTPGEEQ